MNALQTNRLAMYIIVAKLENEGSPVILTAIPQFPNLIEELKTAVAEINAAAAKQQHYKMLGSQNKKLARTSLETRTFDIAAFVRAYASGIKDLDLASEWQLTESRLYNAKDNDLLLLARRLSTVATDMESQLGTFGLTKNDITLLTVETDNFEALMPGPANNRVNKADDTRTLFISFAKADAVLAELDVLMELLRHRHPEVHFDYKSRRTVVKPATKPAALLGNVTNSNGKPLQNVLITVDNYPSYTTTTSDKGRYRLLTLPDGVHNLRYNLHGYHEFVQPISINSGRGERTNIILTK